MSQKDVLHIPLTPSEPSREAGSEEQESHGHRTPVMNPDSGPGGTPGLSGGRHIISPVGMPGRHFGFSVS